MLNSKAEAAFSSLVSEAKAIADAKHTTVHIVITYHHDTGSIAYRTETVQRTVWVSKAQWDAVSLVDYISIDAYPRTGGYMLNNEFQRVYSPATQAEMVKLYERSF